MNDTIKKFIVGLVGLAMVVTLIPAASSTYATTPTIEDLQRTISELNATIAALNATIADLRAQQAPVAPVVTPPVTDIQGVPAGFVFARNLTVGMSGEDVRNLQRVLNANPATRVAVTGAGSPGNETIVFGPATRAAVVRFQEANMAEILTPVGLTIGNGFVGPRTIARLNALLRVVPVAPVAPVTPVVPADPADPAAQEGILKANLRPTPTGVEVMPNSSNVAVMAFRLQAEDSPIRVQRIDLRVPDRPWRHINHIALFDGNNSIRGINVVSANVIDDTDVTSRIRFSGLDINIPENGERIITVKVGTPSSPTLLANFPITVDIDAVRGVDGVGIQHFAPKTSFFRDFEVESMAKGGDIEVRLNPNSPKQGIVITDETNPTTHEILRADLRVTEDNVEVKTLTFSLTRDDLSAIETREFQLLDGTTVIATAAGTATTVMFSDLELEIEKGTTRTLRLQTEVGQNASGAISARLMGSTTTIDAISANDETVTIRGAANGENIHFKLTAPVISNISVAATPVLGADNRVVAADGRISFTLTARGGDVVIPTTSPVGIVVEGRIDGATTTTIATSITIDGRDLTTATEIQRTITEGSSENIVVDARVTGANGQRVWIVVDEINWGLNNIMTGELLRDLRTPGIVITLP